MTKDWAHSQLDAGGFVGLDEKVDEKSTETMIARMYGAPVLGDRVVVRLTSERLVPAEDLSMEFLGLEGRAISPPIAKQNRTALEFGHWALIHQPKHAKYALDLVKRMKAAARKAVSKAGHAWDLYVEMAEELNKSVRHFLPAFWEQAARAYKELGNTTYAGRALAKALEAERVHSLEVDREHRRDAILEFTLSGCLSGKALTDYAKDLERQFPPREAYETYKDLVVRRTLGGMPPIANAASDLAKMAKAAALDSNAELEEVLQAIISSPSMSRVPFQFWKSVKKQVANIVARNPEFAVWLLAHTNPTTSYRNESPVWEWLDLLEEWKVLPYLSMPASELPKDVEIPGGRAGWFSRVASVETSPNKRVFELLEQMKDALKEEKQPIQIGSGYHGYIDVDILDMCLEFGLEVTLSQSQYTLNFDGWYREAVDHPRRNSQLTHLCNDERFRTKLIAQIPELVKFQGDRSQQGWGRTLPARRSFEEATAGHAAIKQVWWEFIDRQLIALETGALADFEMAQEKLDGSCRPKTAEQFPELVERLKKIDLGDCLHRTLVAGVMDEYGWDELDRIAEESRIPTVSRHGLPKIYWAYPFVCWLEKDIVHCVSPTNASKNEILLKKGQELIFAAPVGSQFAFIYYDGNTGWKTYLRWSSAPNQDHEQSSGNHYHYTHNLKSIVPVGADGIFCGDRFFREGDTVVPQAMPNWYHDGQRFWRATNSGRTNHSELEADSTVSEIDPVTAKVIRQSVPPFFEEALPAGATIHWHLSQLMPKPSQPGTSPLGEKNGLLGIRCVRRRDGAMESTGIDGRSWTFSNEEQPAGGFLAALAIVNKPAADSFWIVANDGRVIDSETRKGFSLYNRGRYFAGTPCELPLRFMNSLRVRCEKSSKALRSLKRIDADKLFAAGQVEREARRKKEDPSSPDPEREEATRVVTQLFPSAPARLVTGIARIARMAADEKAAVHSLLSRFEPKTDEAVNSTATNNAIAYQGFKELVLDQPKNLSISYYTDSTLGAHLTEVAKYFSGRELESLPKSNQYWFSLLEDLPAVVWKTFWKRAIREDGPTNLKERLDGAWLSSLKMLAETGLLDLPGSFSLFGGNYDEQSAKLDNDIREKLKTSHEAHFSEGDSRYIAYLHYTYPSNTVYVLGYSPKGECKAPKKIAFESSKKIESKWDRKQVIRFVNALSKLDSLPLPSAEKLNEASARLGLHPIGVALLWMGNLRTTPYGQEKLTKELREFYGWKVKDIQVALLELQSVTIPEGLYSNCLKEPGYLLTQAGHNFDSMIKALAEARRSLAPFPPEVSKELDRAFPGYPGFPLKEFNELIMAPKEAELLKLRKVDFKLPISQRSYSTLEVELTPTPTFEPQQAYTKIAKGISIINYRLPVGHAVRRQIPQAIESLRAFLDHPETLLPIGQFYIGFDAKKTDMETLIGKLAATMGKFEKDQNSIYRCATDTFIVATIPPSAFGYFYTSKLKTLNDLQTLVGALQPVHQTEYNAGSTMNPRFAISMRSDGMTGLAECNRKPRIAEGLWEQYPLHSVSALVAECSKKLKVDEMAAALYLQILALPDPTSANLKLWNGWNTKQIQSSSAQLVEKELLVEAKRERAGRELFLPGGWEPLKAPNLPIETWKLPLFGFENTDDLRGSNAEFIVYEGPIASLFESAWNRWKAGDVPAYAEAPIKPKKPKKK